MAADLRKLKPSELVRIVNSTSLGTVLSIRKLTLQRERAGLRIGQGAEIDLIRYAAWLVAERHGPRPEPSADPYQAAKEKARKRSAEIFASGRDIGDLGKVADPERRQSTRDDFGEFCRTYSPMTFSLPWSPDHLKVIAQIEETVLRGGLFATAMPRGSGKTSMLEFACLWSILHGHRDFVCLIGSDEGAAIAMLDSIKVELESNDLIGEDFPEAVIPIRRLEGIANRCKGQLYGEERTHIGWTADEVVMATVKPRGWTRFTRSDGSSLASGSVVRVAGLTGGIRGMKAKRQDGTSIRPSFVVLDDPQTDQALDIDTPIPTPNGFVPMGSLAVGDSVFDENGRVCRVTATSPIMEGHPCYRVTFDDGESVIADGGHKWRTSTALQRTNGRRRRANPDPSYARRPQCQPKALTSIVTTEDMAWTLTVTKDGRFNHSIPTAGILEGQDEDLPVPPYTLGAWLGDGSASCGRITTADPEILGHIAADGFHIGKEVPSHSPVGIKSRASTYQIKGLSSGLRQLELIGSKRIPRRYLFGLAETRLALLQGLMDTDGSITLGIKGTKGTRCTFVNTNSDLIAGVVHLCRSLGIKPTVKQKRLSDIGVRDCWHVSFITDLPVFKLSRKADRIPREVRPDVRRRYVVNVDPVPSRPVRCIQVDSPTHLYLCGRGLIPTHNSARSPSQCAIRERIIAGAVLGLAGPGKKIAGIMPCTVIARGDMADCILDREKHPEWNGTRTKMVYSFPTAEKFWDAYRTMREDGMRSGDGGKAATEFYRQNRDAMDEGASVAWPERFNDDELSGIQHAMNLKIRDEPAFWAEYQNEPLPEVDTAGDIDPEAIASKVNRLGRGIVPLACHRVTAFVDVHANAHYYVVAAWGDDFTGSIIDYGTYPKQDRPYFTLREAKQTLARATGAAGTEGQVFGGLEAITEMILGREWMREDGSALKIERCLVDAKWGPMTSVIKQFCRQSAHSVVITPSFGKYIGAASPSMAEWQRKDGEKVGLNWRLRPDSEVRRQRYVTFDTNWWKSFLHARLAVAIGDRGSLSLFGKGGDSHRMLVDHLVAEYRVPVVGRGRTTDEWKDRPERPDNHFFDCAVGACVAASMQGVTLAEARRKAASEVKPRRGGFSAWRERGRPSP